MNILEALLLGLVQGISEFLPISSSGHLVVMESLLDLRVEELKEFDVALHVATLLAILVYFRRDFLRKEWWPWLILGSIPAAIVGFTLEDQIDATFRNANSVAFMLMGVGALFFIPERAKNKPLTWWRVFLIACAQAVALIPGVSRSGATIFMGMQLGIDREEAARFSFLLGAIAIAGAGFFKALELQTSSFSFGAGDSFKVMSVGFLAAFVSSLFAVSWLMKFLKNHSFRAFGLYRLAIGALILLFL